MLCQIDRELVEVVRRETQSILTERCYAGMSTFSFEKIFGEMRTLPNSVLHPVSHDSTWLQPRKEKSCCGVDV